MDSDSKKQSFMSFDTIYEILKETYLPVIVQLEGGEPTTHPQFYLFLEYISTLDNVKEIVIDTNALMLDKHIDKIVEIAVRNKKLITVKPSYNTYLRTAFSRGNFSDYLANLISACEFIPYIKFAVNVRGYSGSDLRVLMNSLPEKIRDISNFHLLNSYGRAENDKTLPDLQINEVYNNWYCYASDGECFGRDLKARAKYESKL